jgi:hypothetical protein
MARPKGIIRIEGSLGDFSFYESKYGPIVRRKGGASKKKIATHPNFVRLREHHEEFSHCAAAGSLFRQALKRFTQQTPDHTLVWRVTSLMHKIKDCDTQSVHGKRLVANGLNSPTGKGLLKGFALNRQATASAGLLKALSGQGGSLVITNLLPGTDLNPPAGATHVRLTGIVSGLDLTNHQHAVHESSATLALNQQPVSMTLTATTTLPAGQVLYLLQVIFLQETGGVLYALKDAGHHSMTVVEVV